MKTKDEFKQEIKTTIEILEWIMADDCRLEEFMQRADVAEKEHEPQSSRNKKIKEILGKEESSAPQTDYQ